MSKYNSFDPFCHEKHGADCWQNTCRVFLESKVITEKVKTVILSFYSLEAKTLILDQMFELTLKKVLKSY